MDIDQEQVQVRFVSRQPKYAVNDAAILVPSSFRRYGLSEIVNNLLDNEKPIPFDFFVEGQILKTSIADYLTANRLSTENTVTIEYVESMLPPSPVAAFQHDDWVSSVQGKDGLFLTGSYDGMSRLWNSSGECVATFKGHNNAVKSVAFGHGAASEDVIAYSGSLDHSILAWKYSSANGAQQCLFECKGHKGSVESIAVDRKGEYLASASSDGTVKVWTTAVPEEEEAVRETSTSAKHRKTEAKNARKIKSKAITLEGHVGAVNAVVYDGSDSNTVYTGGWDHSIRSWDVEQQVNLVTKNCEKVVIDVDYSALARLIATGHSDNTLRLWDPRSEEGTNVKATLRGHSGWISAVAWSPSSEYSLCSGSYDGTVRVWDIRSKGPLYTINEDDSQDKVYAVDWSGKHIVSGGEDKKLRIYQTQA